MPENQSHLLLTPDVRIIEVGEIVGDGEIISCTGRLDLPNKDSRDYIRDLLAAPEMSPEIIGRSGHSRFGLDVFVSGGINNSVLEGSSIVLPVDISYLSTHKSQRVLESIKNFAALDRIRIGRLLFRPPESLSAADIKRAIRKKKLQIPESAKILEDGVVEFELEDFLKIIDPIYLRDPEIIRQILIGGKHETKRVQFESKLGRSEEIQAQEFMVGGFRLSIMEHIAYIERTLSDSSNPDNTESDPAVIHLAARVLDPIRTTGLKSIREAEIFNSNGNPIKTKDLRLRVRFYNQTGDKQKAAHKFFQRALRERSLPRIHETGVGFKDVTDIQNPRIFEELIRQIPDDKFGLVLAQNRFGFVPLREDPTNQKSVAELCSRKIFDENPEFVSDDENEFLQEFCSRLNFVGGDQHLGKVFISHNLPDADTIKSLSDLGVGVFIAEDVKDGDIYTDSHHYATIKKLTDGNLRFFVLLGEEGEKSVYEFYKSAWVRTDCKERLDRVSTVIPMYGSHKDKLQELLEEDIFAFFEKMAQSGLFGEAGEEMAVTHGKSTGTMKTADKAARSNGILSIGIGIDVRAIGQTSNMLPEIMFDFEGNSTTTRQEVMDQLAASFRIYNLGGFGTEEECAMARKNIKISEYFIGPQIFVDPTREEEHFWSANQSQAQKIVEKGLGDEWVVKNCHYVRDYSNEAFGVIANFVEDPERYWREIGVPEAIIDKSLRSGAKILKNRGIKIPPYIQKVMGRRGVEIN